MLHIPIYIYDYQLCVKTSLSANITESPGLLLNACTKDWKCLCYIKDLVKWIEISIIGTPYPLHLVVRYNYNTSIKHECTSDI